MPNSTRRRFQVDATESDMLPTTLVPPSVMEELSSNPQRCLLKSRRGSRPHCLALCSSIREIDENLQPSALRSICSHSPSLREIDLTLARGIVYAVATAHLHSATILPPASQGHRQALNEPIVEYWSTVTHSSRICFDAFFKDTLDSFSDFDVMKKGPAKPCTVLRHFLSLTTSNPTLGKSFFGDQSLTRIQMRFWLWDMANSKPGQCPIESQMSLWLSFLHVETRTFSRLILEESGDKPERVAYLAISELRRGLRKRNATTYQVMCHARTLIAIMDGLNENSLHKACIDQGGLTVLTQAILKLLNLGGSSEVSATVLHTIAQFLGRLRFVFGTRNSIPLLVRIMHCGLFTIILKASRCLESAPEQMQEASFDDLLTTLTHYLVFDSVVRAAVAAMEQVEKEVSIGIQASCFADAWNRFRAILLERAIFKWELDRSIQVNGRRMFCQSCKSTFSATELKMCAKCKDVFYCSRECQKMDWGAERQHEEVCNESLSYSKRHPRLSFSDTYFFTQFVNYDIRFRLNGLLDLMHQNFPGVSFENVIVDAFLTQTPREYTVCVFDGSGEDLYVRGRDVADDEGRFFEIFKAKNDVTRGPCPIDDVCMDIDIKFVHGAQDTGITKSTVFSTSELAPIPPLRPSVKAQDLVLSVRPSVILQFEDIENEKDTTHTLAGSYDEISAIMKYIMLKNGLEDTYASLASFSYSWEKLSEIALECRESEWWPFEKQQDRLQDDA